MMIEQDHLPEICWHWWNKETKRREPRQLDLTNPGIGLHKIGLQNLDPDDPFNYQRIRDEILLPSQAVPSALSYNYIIRRSGRIMEQVPFALQAKHAGYSRLDSREYCNNFLFGVACIGAGKEYRGAPALTPMQKESLVWLCAWLVENGNVNPELIVSHALIRNLWNSYHPDKKAASRFGDPGADVPWDEIRAATKEALARRNP